MELMKPVIMGQAPALPDQTQFEKAKNILINVYNNKINQLHIERDRLLLVLEYLEENDPTCAFEFTNNDETNTMSVLFNFLPDIRPQIDAIQAGEQPGPISKVIKAKMTRIANKRKKDAATAIK